MIVDEQATVDASKDTKAGEQQQQPAPSTSSRRPQASAVPQLKLAADGSLIIDEASLLIECDQTNTNDYSDGSAIVELESDDQLDYNSYRKLHHHTKKRTAQGE